MTPPIDIFRIDGQGPRWLECAASLAEAKANVQKLAGASLAEYLLVDQLTGQRVLIKMDGENAEVNVSPSLSTERRAG